MSTMYVLKLGGIGTQRPQVIRYGDRHTVAVRCINEAFAPPRRRNCTVFVYKDVIYVFAEQDSDMSLYRVHPEGESMLHLRTWSKKNGSVIDTQESLIQQLDCFIKVPVSFRGSRVIMVRDALHISLDMDTLELQLTKFNDRMNCICTRPDGSTMLYRMWYFHHNSPVSLSFDEAGNIVVRLTTGIRHHRLLFGEYDTIYLYYDGRLDIYQSMVLVESRPSDMDSMRADNNMGGGIHAGISAAGDSIIIWNPRDDTAYAMPLEIDGKCYHALISG